MSYDIEQIKSANPIEQVVGERIELKKSGHKHTACCPFHHDKTPSFFVDTVKQKFNCYGCGEYGDVLDFIVRYEGVDFKTACAILGGEQGLPDAKTRPQRVRKIIKSIYDGIEPITPVPAEAELMSVRKRTPKIYNPNRESYTTFKPSMVFEYHNAIGQLIGYVLRIDLEDGVKITPAVMWCKSPKFEGWCLFTFPKPRPLYGLERIERNPDTPVLIVEGEKAADAAHILLPAYIIVTWSGGTQAVNMTDWKPLSGRKILIWPDADQAGVDAALQVAQICEEVGAEQIKIIAWDKAKPKGWDSADALIERLTKEQIMAWAKERVSIWPPSKPVSSAAPVDDYDIELSAKSSQRANTAEEVSFRALGYRDNVFYYMPDLTQQILALSPGQHTHAAMMILECKNYWETHNPSNRGVDWDSVTEAVMSSATKRGYFDGHDKLRGRGAWLDAGRSVLHLGTVVYVDGKPYLPKDVPSRYIYGGDIDLNIDPDTPATTREANSLAEICSRLPWANPISGALLAGWCVIAPVSGILRWRPHIWLTGMAGSGKSTVLEKIVKPTLGNMMLAIDGKTTEAGTRQQLKQDALPIVYDEAEAEDKLSFSRMQGILNLARTSSSGGQILKGTADGRGTSFSVRSCFCFSSINPSLEHHADETRTTKLVLKKDISENADEKYKILIEDITKIITPDFANRMLARTLAHLHVLQNNCAVFVEAAAKVFKTRRFADQMGNMLGGLYLCYSDKEVSLSEATAWIEQHDWKDFTYAGENPDEMKLLDRIVSHRIKVNTDNGLLDASLGELILIAASGRTEDGISPLSAERELKLNGILADGEHFYIATKCVPLKKILEGTPWAAEWARPLKDIYKAELLPELYFSPGVHGKAVMLPIELLRV